MTKKIIKLLILKCHYIIYILFFIHYFWRNLNTFNDNNYTNFSVSTNSSGDTEITFGTDMTYSADPGDTNTSSMLGVFIKAGSKATGVQTNPEYDYSELGETWSDPRIFRIPNKNKLHFRKDVLWKK